MKITSGGPFIGFMNATTLLGNLKVPVELGDQNTCAKVKLCLFLFTPALETVCRDTEVYKTVSFVCVRMDSQENF